jgi:4-hydroxybenzoate polyprenyltransferase
MRVDSIPTPAASSYGRVRLQSPAGNGSERMSILSDPDLTGTHPTRPRGDAPRGTAFAVAHALRPWQWAKNLLLFAPLALSHKVGDGWRVAGAMLGFVCFCLCASAGYVVNDLRDREADRDHPAKRRRPFASGALSPRSGMVLVVALLALAGAIVATGLFVHVRASASATASLVSPAFVYMLAAYFLLAWAYSAWIKRRLLLDVYFLVGLYTLRVLAGGAAARVPVTPWMLAFCIFFFLSLAFAKRYAELLRVQGEEGTALRGRAYRVEDLQVIRSVGPASGYLAVLVLALYISSAEQANRLYEDPAALWLVCPVLLYWITRLWFAAGRGALDEDPVLYALRHRASLAAMALIAALILAAWLGVPKFLRPENVLP